MQALAALDIHDWNDLQDLQRHLLTPSKTNRVMANTLRMLADSLEFCAILKETYQSHSGMPASVSLPGAKTDASSGTNGQADTTAILTPKQIYDWIEQQRSLARRHAKNSTRSTRKSAKRAHTGKKLSRRFLSAKEIVNKAVRTVKPISSVKKLVTLEDWNKLQEKRKKT